MKSKKKKNLNFGWDLIRTSIGGMIKWMGICFPRNRKRILECIRYFHIFCLDLRPFIEKETITLWKPLLRGKANCFYAILSFRWRCNTKKYKRIWYWQSNHHGSFASSLSSYFQICIQNLFEINKQTWNFFLPRETIETNFRFR